ncbi:hypothetical protein [Pseudomonas sp. R76]|uniref:hypothetical protein n=1 Tax=Pseudomonas sp. R76 TaxID=1573711 RepID=UPI003FA72A58
MRHKVRAGAVRGIFQSMVELMGKFPSLPCPKLPRAGTSRGNRSRISTAVRVRT